MFIPELQGKLPTRKFLGHGANAVRQTVLGEFRAGVLAAQKAIGPPARAVQTKPQLLTSKTEGLSFELILQNI